MSKRSADVTIAAGLAALALVVWKVRVLGPATKPFEPLGNGDLYTQLYPMAYRAAAWMRSGVLPLWNPYQYAGQPFLATGIYGVLYPFNVFYLVLPARWGMEAVMVFHLIVAGVSTYAYARVLGLAPIAAATSGVGYMLSGFLLVEATAFPPAVAAASWLPLALTAVERIIERRSIGWTLVLAAAVALAFLAGWPQTWLYSVYLIATYVAVRIAMMLASPSERAHVVRASALVALGLALALGLIAAQLLPSLELQALGPRQAGALTRAQLMPYGSATPELVAGQALDPSPGQPRYYYLGIAPLLLIALAALAGRRLGVRAAIFALLGLFALGVVLSTPLLEVYFALPRMQWFRSPARIVFWYVFGGAVLAGIGMDALGRSERRIAAALALVAAAVVAVIVIVARTGATVPRFTWVYLGVASLLVAGALLTRGATRRVLQVCLLAFVVCDLGSAIRNELMHPAQNPQVFDAESTVLSYVKEHQGLDRTYVAPPAPLGKRAMIGLALEVPAMPKQGTLREIYSITDYEPLSLNRYRLFFTELEAPGQRLPEYLTFTGKLRADPFLPSFRLLDLMSVRYLATTRYDTQTLFGLQGRSAEWKSVPLPAGGGYVLFERTDVLPRAYVAFGGQHADGEREAFDAIRDPAFDPRRSVVLEGAQPATAGPGTPPIQPARITVYEPSRVVIETDTAEPGHLVLTDTFYPGWRADVDGETRPIVRANYLFRAVALSPGHHVVTFRYAPASFRIGAAITLATLLAMAALAVAARRQRQPRAAITSTAAMSAPTT